MTTMSRLKSMLVVTEVMWKYYFCGVGLKRNIKYAPTLAAASAPELAPESAVETLQRIEYCELMHILTLILRGMVGGVMPDSLYRSLCARFMTILHACMDMEFENEGKYLRRAKGFKLFKEQFDIIIDTYLAHQSRSEDDDDEDDDEDDDDEDDDEDDDDEDNVTKNFNAFGRVYEKLFEDDEDDDDDEDDEDEDDDDDESGDSGI